MMSIRIECKQRHGDIHSSTRFAGVPNSYHTGGMDNDMLICMCNRDSLVLCFGCSSRVPRRDEVPPVLGHWVDPKFDKMNQNGMLRN